MDERLLFERIHEALDVDPRPAGYERMRSALIAKTSTPRRRAGFQLRWNKMGFRLAAAIVLVAVAVTAGAVFFATHQVAQRNVPAKLDPHAVAYQQMTGSDDTALVGSYSNHCDTLADTGCVAALGRIDFAVGKWVADLDSYGPPPSQFATIDQQVRVHLGALSSDLDAAIAGYQANDQAGLYNGLNAAQEEGAWLQLTNAAISHARPASASEYLSSVRSFTATVNGCTLCQQLAQQSAASCASNPCDFELSTAKQAAEVLQSGDTRLLAPAPFKARDTKLQADLATADDALIALRKALVTGDLSSWDAQRVIFGQALGDIEKDISAITG